jgi:hypothetical protein
VRPAPSAISASNAAPAPQAADQRHRPPLHRLQPAGQPARLPVLDHQRVGQHVGERHPERGDRQQGQQRRQAAGAARRGQPQQRGGGQRRGGDQVAAAAKAEQGHRVRQQAEHRLERPGGGRQRAERGNRGGLVAGGEQQRAHRLRQQAVGRRADALDEVDRPEQHAQAGRTPCPVVAVVVDPARIHRRVQHVQKSGWLSTRRAGPKKTAAAA